MNTKAVTILTLLGAAIISSVYNDRSGTDTSSPALLAAQAAPETQQAGSGVEVSHRKGADSVSEPRPLPEDPLPKPAAITHVSPDPESADPEADEPALAPPLSDPVPVTPVARKTPGRAAEAASGPDKMLWALLAQDRTAELRAEVVRLSLRDPEWEAPAGLMDEADILDETARIINAAAAQQFGFVISQIRTRPALLRCERPDMVWAANEAVYQEMSPEEGMDAVLRNMSGCLGTQELREETVLKTARFASRAEMERLQMTLSDETLDQAFMDAAEISDIRVLDQWVASAKSPRFVRPGDQDVAQKTGDPSLVEGDLRPVPGGSLYFQEPDDARMISTTEALSGTGTGEGGSANVEAVYVATSPVDAETRKAADRLSEADLSPDQLARMGWFFYQSGDPRRASAMFRQARLGGYEGQDAVDGQVLSEIAYEDYVSAEALIPSERPESWREDQTYLIAASDLVAHSDRKDGDVLRRGDLKLTPEQAGRIQEAALRSGSWDLTEKLGWHAHRIAGCSPAIPWWRMSAEKNPDLEPAAFGLAMCLAGTDSPEMRDIRTRWSPVSPRIAMIFGDWQHTALASRPSPRPGSLSGEVRGDLADPAMAPGTPTVITAADAHRYAQTPDPVPQPAPGGDEVGKITVANSQPAQAAPHRSSPRKASDAGAVTASAPLAEGWRLMELGRPMEAVEAFRQAARSGSDAQRRDAAYGESLAYLREGLYVEAQKAITKEPQNRERAEEVSAAILAEQALDQFSSNKIRTARDALEKRAAIAPETPDLMTLRGWTLWRSGNKSGARKVWEQAASLGDANATEALAETRVENR